MLARVTSSAIVGRRMKLRESEVLDMPDNTKLLIIQGRNHAFSWTLGKQSAHQPFPWARFSF
jgi:hypothetical protein